MNKNHMNESFLYPALKKPHGMLTSSVAAQVKKTGNNSFIAVANY
jgi:hypothetical protein